MRVAVDASCLGWARSGTGTYLRNVLRHLAEDSRFELLLVTNGSTPVSGIDGAREIAWRVKSAVAWRATALPISAVRHRADILWCPWPKRPLIVPRGLPTAVTVHDISPVLHRGTKPRVETLAMAVAGRRAVRGAKAVLCVSQTTADDISHNWAPAPDRLHVVPLAVEERFTPGDRDEARGRVRSRWGLDGPFLLAVGTVEPRKGYDLLVELADRLPRLPIVVAGRHGPLSSSLTAELRRKCTMLGAVTDQELLELYRAAEVLLVPSRYEGFGLTPLEAMACGTPAIAAQDSGALSAMLEGIMPVVPRVPAAWAHAVVDVLLRREELSRVAAAHALGRSWNDVARETGDVLSSIPGAA